MKLFYPSKIELVNAAKSWAEDNKFLLSISSSDKKRVVLVCIFSGKPRDHGKPTYSNKKECPFKIYGRVQSNEQWKVFLTNPIHNHQPIVPQSVPQGRQLTDEQKDRVIKLHESLVAPRQIVNNLGLSSIISTKDIYNVISAGKRRKLDGQTPLQYLLKEFQDLNCFCKYLLDSNSNLAYLFSSTDRHVRQIQLCPYG